MHRKPLFLLLTILLVSCASAPPKRDLDTGVTLPVRQQASQTVAEIDSAWWMEFVDSQLNQILGEAFAKNYDLTIAAANLQAAAAQARIAGAPLYPQANLSFNGLRAKQNFIGFPLPGAGGAVVSTTTNSFGVAMNVSWELDLWGRLRADKAGALAQLQASHADFIGARLSLAAQVSKTWFAAIEAKRQMELSQATVDNWRLSHERVQRRYESGLTSSLDLRLSQANLSIAEANLSASKSQYENVLRQLETLVRRYPSASMDLSPGLPEVSQEVPAGLPADLVSRRPDLAAAERRVAAAYAGVSSAKRALLPQISLTGSGGTSSNELGDLLNGDFSVWSIAGSLLQPIFQGGRLRANVDLAKTQGEIALTQYQQAALNAFAEVENALANEQYLNGSQIALEEATSQALAARDLAEAQYNRGLINFVTMLETQRSAYDNERQLLTVRRQRLDARIDLYLALGGGFTLNRNSKHL
jgi:NodT family efflux transporter outer membrane factor (OMF) lipoprotein